MCGMRRAPVAVGVIVSLSAAACGSDLPDRYWRSDNVRYFSRPADDSVCPDVLGEIEEHAQVIGDALGIERPLVTYYKYDGDGDYKTNAACGDGASACARNATVNSPEAFDRHELIHAYLAPYGLPPRLFIEGAAVALSCQHVPRPTISWRDALNAERLSPELYSAGGWLAGYLMRMFRKTWFVNLYGSLQFNATADEVDAVFRRIYNMSLDDVWAAAIGGPQAPMICPWECSRPAFPADGQPHALSPVCGTGATQFTVAVPGDGAMRWLLDGDSQFSMVSCEGNDVPLHAVTGGDGTGALLAWLTLGKVTVDAVVNPGGTGTLSIDTNALSGLTNASCILAPPIPDDLSRYQNLTLFFPGFVAPQVATFANGDDREAVLQLTSDDPSATGALCTSCDPATCTAASTKGGLAGSIASGTALRIGVESADGTNGPSVTANISWFTGAASLRAR